MASVHLLDEATGVAWKARALYLTAMGADVDYPDMEAIRLLALELSQEADKLLENLDPKASPIAEAA